MQACFRLCAKHLWECLSTCPSFSSKPQQVAAFDPLLDRSRERVLGLERLCAPDRPGRRMPIFLHHLAAFYHTRSGLPVPSTFLATTTWDGMPNDTITRRKTISHFSTWLIHESSTGRHPP